MSGINIIFTDKNVSMEIIIDEKNGITSSKEKVEINGFAVYIDDYYGHYSSMMSYNHNIYCVTSTNRDSIIKIFEHMNKE